MAATVFACWPHQFVDALAVLAAVLVDDLSYKAVRWRSLSLDRMMHDS